MTDYPPEKTADQAFMFEWYPLSSVAVLAVSFLLYRIVLWRRDSLSYIPYHRFDRDDTPQRYAQDSEGLLHSGYLKVSVFIPSG